MLAVRATSRVPRPQQSGVRTLRVYPLRMTSAFRRPRFLMRGPAVGCSRPEWSPEVGFAKSVSSSKWNAPLHRLTMAAHPAPQKPPRTTDTLSQRRALGAVSEKTKKALKETEIRTRYITPAIVRAGWDPDRNQVREEYTIAPGRIMVRGKLHARLAPKSADYVLFLKHGLPLAVVEAKDNNHSVGAGMQQAQGYADRLDVPFIFSSNGDGFLFHDRTVTTGAIERELTLNEFPSPNELHQKWLAWKGMAPGTAETKVVEQDYYFQGKELRYYQLQAVNRTVEAVARGQNRALLVMATGTGKTFTAFQIIWRLWKSHRAKRVLFLADRNILVDQTRVNDFKPFGTAMTKITNRTADPSFEIFLAIYQAITGTEDEQNIYKQFSPDFFDLIVVDECHRGSAREDAQWREVLEYFTDAVQVGLTATPKETADTSNITYFGEPVFTYSLKQGIDDGYLAPYKVVRVDLDKDLQGWRPEEGKVDKHGELIEDRVYNQRDFDRNLVLEKRTELVAKKVTQYLKESGDRFAKTIVFCQDIDHAERMRSALANENADLVAQNRKYVMRITGDDAEGKAELDNFIDPESRYPVIATTSELMSTGIDAQTCKLIVLDQSINSMTRFKQIIGRGTRINEEHGKFYFTIMDFRKVTELFADPDFDGDPVVVYTPGPDEPLEPPEGLDPTDPDESRRAARRRSAVRSGRPTWSAGQVRRRRHTGHTPRRTGPVHGARWEAHHREPHGLHTQARAGCLSDARHLPHPVEGGRQQAGHRRRAAGAGRVLRGPR